LVSDAFLRLATGIVDDDYSTVGNIQCNFYLKTENARFGKSVEDGDVLASVETEKIALDLTAHERSTFVGMKSTQNSGRTESTDLLFAEAANSELSFQQRLLEDEDLSQPLCLVASKVPELVSLLQQQGDLAPAALFACGTSYMLEGSLPEAQMLLKAAVALSRSGDTTVVATSQLAHAAALNGNLVWAMAIAGKQARELLGAVDNDPSEKQEVKQEISSSVKAHALALYGVLCARAGDVANGRKYLELELVRQEGGWQAALALAQLRVARAAVVPDDGESDMFRSLYDIYGTKPSGECVGLPDLPQQFRTHLAEEYLLEVYSIEEGSGGMIPDHILTRAAAQAQEIRSSQDIGSGSSTTKNIFLNLCNTGPLPCPFHAFSLCWVQRPKDSTDTDNNEDKTLPLSARKKRPYRQGNRSQATAAVATTISVAQLAAELVDKKCRNVVALTGAGISGASGLPTRQQQWQRRLRDDAVANAAAFASPLALWEACRELVGDASATPNQAHVALDRLGAHLLMEDGNIAGDEEQRRFAIVTQNVDQLHQRAPLSGVFGYPIVPLHGSLFEPTTCRGCGGKGQSAVELVVRHNAKHAWRESGRGNTNKNAHAEAVRGAHWPPKCRSCERQRDNVLLPSVVLFGDIVPASQLTKAAHLHAAADVLLVIGTAGDVAPAADLIAFSRRRGAKIVEIKRQPSRLQRAGMVDVFLQGPAEETLPELANLVASGLGYGGEEHRE
jgi:NAD-dependent deacetylase